MDRPIVIAHRGASGYLPEHTLAGKALAFGMGADYLEQDVVATADGELIVFHDLTLEQVTNVRDIYPQRARADGRYYCIDFTLAELRALGVGARYTKDGRLRHPGRLQADAPRFPIPTLVEEIRFIQGLNASTGQDVGIYPEIKEPAWHQSEGCDITAGVVKALESCGYRNRGDPVFLQCFDPRELQRIREEFGSRLRLVQLLDAKDGMPDERRLSDIAGYANAIGPPLSLFIGSGGDLRHEAATLMQSAGLALHPYTFRADELPAGFTTFADLLRIFVMELRVDGLFTDFPDQALAFLSKECRAAGKGRGRW